MKNVLKGYKMLYTQLIGELAKNDLTPIERRLMIETLYNTEINITIAENNINK